MIERFYSTSFLDSDTIMHLATISWLLQFKSLWTYGQELLTLSVIWDKTNKTRWLVGSQSNFENVKFTSGQYQYKSFELEITLEQLSGTRINFGGCNFRQFLDVPITWLQVKYVLVINNLKNGKLLSLGYSSTSFYILCLTNSISMEV